MKLFFYVVLVSGFLTSSLAAHANPAQMTCEVGADSNQHSLDMYFNAGPVMTRPEGFTVNLTSFFPESSSTSETISVGCQNHCTHKFYYSPTHKNTPAHISVFYNSQWPHVPTKLKKMILNISPADEASGDGSYYAAGNAYIETVLGDFRYENIRCHIRL